jgi:hypothetical protein
MSMSPLEMARFGELYRPGPTMPMATAGSYVLRAIMWPLMHVGTEGTHPCNSSSRCGCGDDVRHVRFCAQWRLHGHAAFIVGELPFDKAW